MDDGGSTGGTGGMTTDSTASTSSPSTTTSTTAATSDTGDSTGDPDTGTTGGMELQILEVSPADGEAGVTDDAVIVVTFSEPMNKAATQAAYQSADIPAAMATFSWNDAGDELTITPNELLEYAEGDDPDTLEALSYAWTITSAAESADGDVLAEDQSFSFTTLRRFLQNIAYDQSLTGKITDLNDKAKTPYLGDYDDNDTARYFVTFDLGSLAPDVADVEMAELNAARLEAPIGTPFTQLGGVDYAPVVFDALEGETFDIDTVGGADWLFPTSDDVDVGVDATDHLEAALADPGMYGNRLQYRFAWFPNETDGNDDLDGITLSTSDIDVWVLYLAP